MELDDFGKLAYERYVALVDQYNAQVNKTKTVESREKFQETFMAEDPQFAEFNEKIEKLESALESVLSQRLIAATPLVETAYQNALANVGVDPEALKETKKQIAASSKFLTSMYSEDVLKDAPKPEAMRVTSGTSNAGSGGRRIRGFDWYVDGEKAQAKNSQGVLKSTATVAARVLDVAVPDLQEAFFKNAGSEDYKNESFPTVVDFEFAGKNVRVVKVDDSDEE